MTRVTSVVLSIMLPAVLLNILAATVGAQQSHRSRYLATHMHTADPSAHVFDGKLYIYPSHDIETNVPDQGGADKFDMKDYHVLSMDSVDGEVTDHGVALALQNVPWASRQMWAPDCAFNDGKYYLYFPAKDRKDVFRIGVAESESPEGPFTAMRDPIAGSYSIDPSVFRDDDGAYYLYFGGLWGGQLQSYRDNQPLDPGKEPANNEPALCAKVARLSESMKTFADEPRDVQLLDETGTPLRAGDHDRRFFEAAWMHKYRDQYYFSYSTGDTHRLCYAVGDSPDGPFTYRGVILTPVVGWTTHHSITEYEGKWYLFYHDSRLSGGKTHLRNIKVIPLEYDAQGNIKTIDGSEKP